MSQRRLGMVSLYGGRLKVVWMDERGNKLGEHVLRHFDAKVTRDSRLLAALAASLARIDSAAGLNFQIQAESVEVYRILTRNQRIHALLNRGIGPSYNIHEEFRAWTWPSDSANAQEDFSETKGASDNGITSEEGDSNE